MWTSFEQSLGRRRSGYVDLAVVHDVDRAMHGAAFNERYAQIADGCWPALSELRDAGVIRAIGVSTRETDVALRVLRDLDAEALVMAGSYTLLASAPAGELFPKCPRHDVAVLFASPFNTGILATGDPDTLFDYVPAPATIRERLAGLPRVGERHGVPLAAAALQFPLRHLAVASVIAGNRTAEELDSNVADLAVPVPEAYWHELVAEGLIPREDVAA